MAESGVDRTTERLYAELDETVQTLRRAVRDDPDASAATDLQGRAERAVGKAVLLLTDAALVDAAAGRANESHGEYSGRVMLARDLLVAVDLARRAVAARMLPPIEPMSDHPDDRV